MASPLGVDKYDNKTKLESKGFLRDIKLFLDKIGFSMSLTTIIILIYHSLALSYGPFVDYLY